MEPTEYAVAAFIVFFLLAATALLLVFYREKLGQRLQAILEPADPIGASAPTNIRRVTESFSVFAESVQKVVPKSGQDVSAIQQRLAHAGYRSDKAPNILFALKALVPVFLCIVAGVTGVYRLNPLAIFGIAIVVGYLLPDFVLDHMIEARADEMRVGLPDVIDLLVVCLEAGLSIDQALLRGADEMRVSHPALADELGLVMLDLHAGRARVDAWRRFAERTDLDSTRLLVSIFIQADQFGSGISKTLRVHSDGMRIRRRQRVEEVAAKTHVKLVFPLVLFIFPSLFIVTLGPAFILMSEAFHK